MVEKESEGTDKMWSVVSHRRPFTIIILRGLQGHLMTLVTGNPWWREEFTIWLY